MHRVTFRNRPRRVAAATLTILLYASGVGFLPTLHAAAEAAWSDASVEAAHSDNCPSLQDCPICAAIAGLATAIVGGSPAPPFGIREAGSSRFVLAEHLPHDAHDQPHLARAPPLL